MPRQPIRPAADPAGVIRHGASLLIDLRAQGYGRERLALPPTPANLRYAERLRNDILGKIERGTFALVDYFPDSARVANDKGSMTWPKLCEEWLDTRRNALEHSTLATYEQTIHSRHFKEWAELHLPDLDFRALSKKLGALPATPKTFNNIASVMRLVLEYGYDAKLLREPLHLKVEFRKNSKPRPDPLILEEVDLLLAKMTPIGRSYYEFACFSGLRPSEQIVLSWRDVDLRAGTVMVDKAMTRGKVKGTKNGERREVELNGRARAALERQRAVSQLRGASVFLSLDGEPYTTTDGPLDAFWKPAMRLSGLRYRDARQTRHTYATMCLHAGLKPGWVSQQLGHSVEMFYRVYSKWINAQDRGQERNKLDAYLVQATGPARQAQPVT